MDGDWVDRRLGGQERSYFDPPRDAKMRVPDTIRYCAVYIGMAPRKAGDVDELAPEAVELLGTGFIVAVPSEAQPLSWDYPYVVTARHVIEIAHQAGREVCVVANTKKDGIAVRHVSSPWRFPENAAIDVAVTFYEPRLVRNLQFHSLSTGMFATDEVVEREGIGIGDELITVGLFAHHPGSTRNMPIVRGGIIAAMSDEPFRDEHGLPFGAYLAELRSIGGLSGSPVFAVLPPNRLTVANREQPAMYSFYLLGLIRGHWHQEGLERSPDRSAEEPLNIGIALVTPITDVLELLQREDMVEERKAADAGVVAGSVTLDSASTEEGEYERFDRLTRQLVQVPKSEIDKKRKAES